jgi:hypothetical protein
MAAQDVAITQDLAQSAVDQLVEQLHPQLHDDDAAPNPDAKGFQLYHHWLRRAREIAGPAAVAILFVLASRADNFTGTCYPSVATVSRESGVGIKKVRVILRLLRRHGLLARRTRTLEERAEHPGGKFEYTLLRDDGPRGHIPVTLGWMQKHAGLWRGYVDAYAEIRAIANGKWQFDRNFDKMRIALGCGSRPTFFRLLAALKEHGLVRHYFDDAGECWWELLELKPPDDVPIKRFLAVRQPPVSKLTHTPADPVSKLTACPDAGAAEPVSRLTHGLYKEKPNVGDDVGIVDGVREVKGELDKGNTTRSTPEARTCEPLLRPPVRSTDLQEETPPATNQEPELGVAIDRMLAKIGVKLNPPPEPKPKVKSAVQLLREGGWIITTDDGWACAEKPGEHNCDGGVIFARDERGHEFTLRCKVCLDAARQPQPVEQEAEPATVEIAAGDFFGSDSLPQLPAFVQRALPASVIDDSFGGFNACPDAKRPEPPGWSKATSGPRRVIVNGALEQLHEVIRDSLGSDLDPPIWRRVDGMLCRMAHRTADEFRDAMAEAVEQLNEKREMHPGGRFYFDFEKSALWAVGRATGCSQWVD